LIRGDLTSKNILFDVDHQIQIADFCSIDQEVGESDQDGDVFSSEGWSPDPGVRVFASILFEIIAGHQKMLSDFVTGEVILPSDIPVFVSELMAARQSRSEEEWFQNCSWS
jgi:hypothetical protein